MTQKSFSTTNQSGEPEKCGYPGTGAGTLGASAGAGGTSGAGGASGCALSIHCLYFVLTPSISKYARQWVLYLFQVHYTPLHKI
jgi:hypothetical protein